MTEPKDMQIRHAIFYCELCPCFYFLTECKILNLVDVGSRTGTASLHG